MQGLKVSVCKGLEGGILQKSLNFGVGAQAHVMSFGPILLPGLSEKKRRSP